MIPITREFLREFYKNYPLPPLDEDIEALKADLKSSVDSLGNDSIVSARNALLRDPPHMIDANCWRLREQFEEIENVLRQEVIDVFYEDNSPAIGEERLQQWKTKMNEMRELSRECFGVVKGYSDYAYEKTYKIVQDYTPNDWRASLLLMNHNRSEKKKEAAMKEYMENGGTIAGKYDILWKNQLERRQTLASLGNAKGMFRFILKVAGVPQVLLDFVKKINDKDGPMEEMRLKYSPSVKALFSLSNEIAATLRSLLESEASELDANKVVEATEGALLALQACFRDLTTYFDAMKDVFGSSPMFISPGDAFKATGKGEGGFIDVNVPSRDEVVIDLSFEKEQVPLTLNYEFKLENKDINFRIVTEENSVLEELERVKSGEMITGNVVLEREGNYKVIFDNKFSVFTSKSVSCKISVLEPQKD